MPTAFCTFFYAGEQNLAVCCWGYYIKWRGSNPILTLVHYLLHNLFGHCVLHAAPGGGTEKNQAQYVAGAKVTVLYCSLPFTERLYT